MRILTRRGFTLVELLIAIVIFGIVSVSIYGLLTRTQRLSRTQAERATMQANIRTGIALVTAELRELNANATQADIYAMSSTAIEYRGLRGLGFVCEVADDEIKVPQDTWNGYRSPDSSRDSLLIFVDNDSDRATDDGWTARAFSPSPSTCVRDGSTVAAWEFDLGSNLGTDTLPMVTLGSPVRTFERMEIGQMTASGETWLGARSISGGDASLQPVLGPLAPNGVSLTYWPGEAGVGSSTSVPSQVRTIRVGLWGITGSIVAAGAGTTPWQRATENLVTIIRLRNAP